MQKLQISVSNGKRSYLVPGAKMSCQEVRSELSFGCWIESITHTRYASFFKDKQGIAGHRPRVTRLKMFSPPLLAYNVRRRVLFTHLVCSCEGQQFQVQRGAMQINHFILRAIIYDVLGGLQIQSPPCSHCHVPCLGLSSVFIRHPAPLLPPLSPESRFIPQIIDYDRSHANREGAKCD